MRAFELQPLDTLFFKDARPMKSGAGSGGHGASWPLPTVLHEALRSALLAQAGGVSLGKGVAHHKTSDSGKKRESHVVSDLFRSLRTVGPFPMCKNTLYFPLPSDVVPTDEKGESVTVMAPLSEAPGKSNYPQAWLKPVYPKAPPSKVKLPPWVAADWFNQYLHSQVSSAPPKIPLYDTEHRIGIGIDPEKRTAADKQIYSAEHLRLRTDVRLWFSAGLSKRDQAHNGNTDLAKLVDQYLSLGGESRMCRIAESRVDLTDMIPPPGKLIKWVLVAPAMFRAGWLPNWVNESDGKVRLKKGATERSGTEKETEERKVWRERVRNMTDIDAHLIAVCIPKPIHFSGWDLAIGGPKPTVLAVPVGSAYYFKAQTEEDGRALVKALHGRTQSDYFGEKGMGLGFCGVWQYVEDNIR